MLRLKMAKKPVKRASCDERQDRLRDIDALFDKGYKPADIARAMEKRHAISRRQAERDIQLVKVQRSQLLSLQTTDSLRSGTRSGGEKKWNFQRKDLQNIFALSSGRFNH